MNDNVSGSYDYFCMIFGSLIHFTANWQVNEMIAYEMQLRHVIQENIQSET